MASLPAADFERLAPALTLVDLPLKQVLLEAEEPIEIAHFLETGMASYLAYLESGEAVEVGIVGSEGMVGLPIVLGVDSGSFGAIVQQAGTALRINPPALKQAFGESEALRNLLMRYMQALHSQVSQTALCNSYHTLEERLSRWLLMTQDRAGGDQFSMTHEFMALMLGVRRAGVTITAGTLKRAGLIHYANGEVTVLDRAGLEQAACECYANVERQFKQLLG
ncbi:Crp/Fnr family transcription regulator [Skermanella stibiiresistens SB22]|uniref:Crp/Fnr family transcription regulator n=1 Tax=Skermanella stibiiresistens SB22 TaxID=1385369 RepID=W9GX90_9PROT|nr:Crp/Fnr family transcriptional regulator [Skermanella stibiiresistens]EWY38525.1 Crp/Fnr family transcription regulator [Skermanella stibiiresistens SB22]